MTRSAGILPYRGGLELLVAHPGGPLWAQRDGGAWSIVKGELASGEEEMDGALREFEEETGWKLPGLPLQALGTTRLKSGKVIVGFAVEAPTLEPSRLVPGTVHIQFRGKSLVIPEIDRVAWVSPEQARRLLNPAQAVFVDRLEALLA